MPFTKKNPIILFDGVCNLCNSSAMFILRHDKRKSFLFASLQSDAAKKLLLHYKYKNTNLNSIVLIDGNVIMEKSTAVIAILRILGMPWSVLSVITVLPKKWRDTVYDFVSVNRYKWFGKQKTCYPVRPKYKNRFI